MTSLALALVLSAGAPPPSVSSVDALAQSLSNQAEKPKLEASCGVYVAGANTDALPRAVRSLLLSRLSAQRLSPVVVDAVDADAAEVQARARGLRSLVRLSVVTEGQELVARGDAVSTWVNFWSGRTPSRQGTAGVLAARAPLDDGARTLAGAAAPAQAEGPMELVLSTLVELPHVPAALAAIHDDEGRGRVAVLMGDEVWLLSADGAVAARHVLTAPASPTPTREAFGVLGATRKPTRLVAFSGRRASAEVLEVSARRLAPAGQAERVPLGAFLAAPAPGLNALTLLPPASPRGAAPIPPAPQSVSQHGDAALFLLSGGRAELHRAGAAVSLRGLGSGSALGDLDGDGTAELFASAHRVDGDGDELRVVSLAAAQALAADATLPEAPTRWQGRLATGRVVTVAAVDFEGDGVQSMVLGLWRADGTGALLLARRRP